MKGSWSEVERVIPWRVALALAQALAYYLDTGVKIRVRGELRDDGSWSYYVGIGGDTDGD